MNSMFDFATAFQALGLLLGMGVIAWLVTLPKQNVNLVDSLWPLFFLVGAVFYALGHADLDARAGMLLILLALWSLRLSWHLSLRNWNKPEDHRYQAIRRNNSPGFGWKSLYIVFGLQATLAWVVALPLFVGLSADSRLNGLDMTAALLILSGLSLETLADQQLARFKADPANQGKVLDRGVWRYSRHPNYFGEACVWWGFWLLAMAGAGVSAVWTLISPILMTFLLLRISGVALLEKDIADRRPDYRDYIARTSAFWPWPPRRRLCKENRP